MRKRDINRLNEPLSSLDNAASVAESTVEELAIMFEGWTASERVGYAMQLAIFIINLCMSINHIDGGYAMQAANIALGSGLLLSAMARNISAKRGREESGQANATYYLNALVILSLMFVNALALNTQSLEILPIVKVLETFLLQLLGCGTGAMLGKSINQRQAEEEMQSDAWEQEYAQMVRLRLPDEGAIGSASIAAADALDSYNVTN